MQLFPPLQMYSFQMGGIDEWKTKYKTEWNPMGEKYKNEGIPANVFLQQFRYAYKENQGILLQFQHLFESGESQIWLSLNPFFSLLFWLELSHHIFVEKNV